MKLLLLSLLAAGAFAARVPVSHLTEDNAPAVVPPFWRATRQAEAHKTVRLSIALKHKPAATAKINEVFNAVSDPKSREYGQHLTREQMEELCAPAQDTRTTVVDWVKSAGVSEDSIAFTRAGDLAFVTLTVAQASQLVGASFQVFEPTVPLTMGHRTIIRSLGPFTAPEAVAAQVDFVVGHIGFPKRAPAMKNLKEKVGATLPVGPKQLRQRYNISAIGTGASNGNAMAVAEFQGQYFSPSDLKTFFAQYMPGSYVDTVTKIVGQNEGAAPGVEAELDIQYIMGVAPNIPAWFWSNPAFDFWSDLTAWVGQINDEKNPPLVHSVSYGDQAEGPAGSYKNRLNTEFQKLGARGLSIIFASGDSGTGCSTCFYFEPSFPATSPYVTSVGATRFLQDSVGPEGAVAAFGSGGGFSWHFPIPSYQADAVNNFFSTASDLPESHFYNRQGRGTPDVAALGIGFEVVVDGSTESVGGTSASAPTFSAVVSLLNDVRLNAKKPSLGFLNHWLYEVVAKTPGALYDVTVGNNQHGCCGYTGFSCQKGWDPVSGLGTPNFDVLKTLV